MDSREKDSTRLQKVIAGFCLYFTKTYRITILLLVGLIAIGYITYTQFLKKEGMPAIEIPITMVQTRYLVDDEQAVDLEVTAPIENSILELSDVKGTVSQSFPNFSVITAELNAGVDTDEGAKQIKEQIESKVELPEEAQISYESINPGSFDGKNDIIISLFSKEDKSIDDLQEKAGFIAEKFASLPQVSDSNAADVIVERPNPFTGATIKQQEGFSRVGIKEDGNLNFYDSINIGIQKNDDYGIVETSDSLRDEISKLRDSDELQGYEIAYGPDASNTTRDQISDLESTAVSSLLVVVLVLFFMINWRASLIGAIFVPTVFFATFIGLYLVGYDLNTMVLFGLILVLGLFVDDAIVVVEAIDYHKRRGEKGARAVYEAIKDIGVADISGTLTTVLVFIPMAYISGVMGDFLKFLPVTIIIALIASILIALTSIAFLASFIIPDYKDKKTRSAFAKVGNAIFYSVSNFFAGLSKKVGGFVAWYLKRPIIAVLILIASLGLIGGGIYFGTTLKFSLFAPPKDSNTILVQFSYPDDATVQEADDIAVETEKIIKDEISDNVEEIEYISSSNQGAYQLITLKDFDERDRTAPDMVEALNNDYKDIDGATIKASVLSAGPPTSSDYKFFAQVYSDNKEVLENASQEIRDYLDNKELSGGEKSYDPVIEYIDTVARKDGERYVQIKSKISDPENSGLVIELEDDIRNEFDADRLKDLGVTSADDLRFDQGLESELMGSFDSAVFFFAVAILAMYVLLVFQYNSYSLPLLILTAIPFSFAGIFPGLYFTDNPLSFFVVIGLIALSGIVVNNTIMLIDFANRRRLSGSNIVDSISEAMSIRFRPILTTTLTTIVALFPLVYVDPFWEPMVYTMIFGLIASTLLAVFAFPVYYCVVEKIREWKRLIISKIISRKA